MIATTHPAHSPQRRQGFPTCRVQRLERLKDGDRFEFRIGPVRKKLDGADLRMLAYNGSIPGPILHVDQGSEITVDVTNEGDVAATVHWHGLRLENRYDGVPHDTQAPIEIGETFTYKVQFPDAGFYWYHPHIREDFGLEMGLYGTIIVEPTDASYWPEVDRQMTITLDDLLVEDGHIAAFNKAGPNFTAMGRFGNVMLINGETSFAGEASSGRGRSSLPRQHGEHAHLQLRSPRSAGPSSSGATAVGTSVRRSSTRCSSLPPSEPSSMCLFDAPGGSPPGASNP